MVHIRRKHGWELPESSATPQEAVLNRRAFMRGLGLATALGAAGAAGLLHAPAARADEMEDEIAHLPALQAKPNPEFALDLPPTPEVIAAKYNNFYEFTSDKDVWKFVSGFHPRPWQLEVGGLVAKKRTFDVDDLLRKMPLEERTYRFRCVEAWSEVIPWVGFPMAALMKEVQPLSSAKYVQMTTFFRPKEAIRQGEKPFFGPPEPWPYTEGLTLAEASNELTLLAVGMYGKELARQHGAPIRLVVPWKYGYKNIKSIVKIDFVAEQPKTFWNILGPSEYGFTSNIDPAVP
ncbi:MAG TPA: protein-methionine-sulfoxide reductase catalytic subunit MsrP, partial [bacterium]|nr:protein-methionine-sulfoxide reductase catalytic subunit MsrP [bacterium]